MKIIFAGTPEFAAAGLRALHTAGHEVALVLTQPDRPAGRGLQTSPSAVKRLALDLALPVQQPQTLKDAQVTDDLAALEADVMVVAAYGLMLPREILALPRRGCINIHASLLPRWRGAAPIQRALLAGDRETGITIMQMNEGLDTGPILLREAVQIAPDDTAQGLHERLAALGAALIVRALERPLTPLSQDEKAATYAAKVSKAEAQIDWKVPAATNERKVRAFNPVPGAATTHRGGALKIWRASVVPGITGEPGTVTAVDASGVTVACGESALKITELQRSGGKRVGAAAFLAGYTLPPGERLGS